MQVLSVLKFIAILFLSISIIGQEERRIPAKRMEINFILTNNDTKTTISEGLFKNSIIFNLGRNQKVRLLANAKIKPKKIHSSKVKSLYILNSDKKYVDSLAISYLKELNQSEFVPPMFDKNSIFKTFVLEKIDSNTFFRYTVRWRNEYYHD